MSEHRLYSVTTLIKTGLGTGGGLLHWHAKTPVAWAADHPEAFLELLRADRDAAIKTALDQRYAKSQKASARGTELHAAAEKIAYGLEPDVSPGVLPYVLQYREFLADHSPRFLMAEAPVYNLTYHYAGTLDSVVEIGRRRLVLDVKTTDKRHDDPDVRSRPPYPEIALQLVAYRRAEVVGIGAAEMRTYNGRRYYLYDDSLPHEEMLETDGAVALVISPSDYQLVPVRVDESVWNAFLYVREAARWQINTAKTVLGPVLAPTTREEEVA
jgi:hypothetical protein